MIRKESSLLASVPPQLVGARAGNLTVARSLQSASKRKDWHAVSIDAKPLSYAAALDLRKTRYSSKNAPALPLKECSKRAACPYTYKHHEDRRAKPRRAAETGVSSTGKKHDSERRLWRGRRDDDQR